MRRNSIVVRRGGLWGGDETKGVLGLIGTGECLRAEWVRFCAVLLMGKGLGVRSARDGNRTAAWSGGCGDGDARSSSETTIAGELGRYSGLGR